MRGDRAVIEARMRGLAPKALFFSVVDGAGPFRCGDVEVSPADHIESLDLRFACALPVAVAGFENEPMALRLYDVLTGFRPARLIFCSKTRLLEWTPNEGETEWEV